jgi:hypothetical protein
MREMLSLTSALVYLGLHPLANALQLRFNINKWIALVVKAVWFDLTLWAAYVLVFGSSIGNPSSAVYEIINKYILLIIFVGGSIIFWLYDYVMFKCQMIVNNFVYRIKK